MNNDSLSSLPDATALFRRALAFDALFVPAVRGPSDLVRYVLSVTPGLTPSRVGILSGPNATGKSLVRKVLRTVCREARLELIETSMQGRTSGEDRIQRLMVYGSEEEASTGVNSVKTTMKLIETSRSRVNPHAVFLDEPETGLCDEYAAGLGAHVAAYLADPPATLAAAFLVSHRARFLDPVVAAASHTYLGLGDGDLPKTYAAWASRPAVAWDPGELVARDRVRSSRVGGAIEAVRKARQAQR